MEAVTAAVMFVAVFALVRMPFLPSAESLEIRRRLAAAKGREEEAAAEAGASPSFRDRVLMPLGHSLGERAMRLAPRAQQERLARKLAAAGDPVTPSQYFLLRLALLCLGVLPAFLGGQMVIAGGALAFLGYRLPEFWLARLETARRRAFARLLPDALDLLSVSVEAGMGFDQAMERLAERSRPPLAQEFVRVLSEMRFGVARRQALEDLGQRMDVPELRQFVSSVVQAEEMGVGLARPLRVQADALRVRRRQKAEEAALKTPVKLLFPLVFLIFPALFVVLLGPAVLSFGQVFHP